MNGSKALKHQIGSFSSVFFQQQIILELKNKSIFVKFFFFFLQNSDPRGQSIYRKKNLFGLNCVTMEELFTNIFGIYIKFGYKNPSILTPCHSVTIATQAEGLVLGVLSFYSLKMLCNNISKHSSVKGERSSSRSRLRRHFTEYCTAQ